MKRVTRKKKLMESARKGTTDAKKRFSERQEAQKLQKVKEKQKAKEEAAQKIQQQKVKALQNLTKLDTSVVFVFY